MERSSVFPIQKVVMVGLALVVSGCFLVPRNVPFDEIRVSDTRVFLKAPSGLEEIFVTLVSDPCATGNRATDYFAKTSVLSYAVRAAGLVLYSNGPISAPTRLKWPIDVKTEVTDPYRFSLFEKTEAGQEIRRFIIQRHDGMPVCHY